MEGHTEQQIGPSTAMPEERFNPYNPVNLRPEKKYQNQRIVE